MQIFSRTEASAEYLAEEVQASYTDDAEKINMDGSLYIIAVNDDVVEEIAEQFHFHNKLVVHTSAMVPMEVLEPLSDRIGVLYPLQTMTKGHELDFREVPVFIEASDDKAEEELMQLALGISDKVFEGNLKKRKTLHIAAVFANNFTNHLYHVSETLLKRDGMSLDILMPLMKETVRKLSGKKAFDVQTGPAKRGDMKTIEEHLEYLNDYPDFREIYLVLTESLISAYREEDSVQE